MSTQAQRIWSRKSGLYFVLLFGVVNLFADMTYEGARSVTGPFLAAPRPAPAHSGRAHRDSADPRL